LIDDETAITLNGDGQLSGWSIAECTETFRMEKVDVAVLSPGRRYVAVALRNPGHGGYLCNSRTGQALGQWETHHPSSYRTKLAFSADGRLLTACAGPWLTSWQLESGSVYAEFPLLATHF